MFKVVLNIVMYLVIFSFVGLLFSAFTFENDLNLQVSGLSLSEFFYENWAFIALVLSEAAALLPGKPKGILHAIVKIINQVAEKNRRPTKFQ